MTSLPSTFSDSETIDDTNSTISEDNTIIHQTVSAQKNHSHMSYFFHVEGDLAYCKICELNFTNTNKKAYDFEFQEVLLSYNHLSYPHTGEVICDELFQILKDWNLTSTAFTVTTDNGMNMVKAVRLLQENYFDQVQHQSCVAHTLQLSVMKGLKQCKAFYRYVKSLQTFFHLPKQAERLYAAQQNFQTNSSENEYVNPLEVLTDVKTKWNLIFIA
ncbi:zinc finger BED domain-containing protein 1-like [Rhizophagus irregularis DAOM 181602=DAOM 197198]|nr:zinc finger BED domain-containing protein 1-like [Rhizophagus irregularis DAOM 181602=DAOM 197198]CAG8646092.1 16765_t:CDS:2 [Rhizophagus irregularis]